MDDECDPNNMAKTYEENQKLQKRFSPSFSLKNSRGVGAGK